MSRYLIVMHQTALSPNLQRTVRALVTEDPAAEFAVLVPDAHFGDAEHPDRLIVNAQIGAS